MINLPRFQFTLRELFLTTALIAFGTSTIAWTVQRNHVLNPIVILVLMIVSIAMIGIGLGVLFYYPSYGIAFAFLAFFAGMVIWLPMLK